MLSGSWIFFGVQLCALVCIYVHSCVECTILRICILVQRVSRSFKDSKLKLLFKYSYFDGFVAQHPDDVTRSGTRRP